MKEKDFTPMQRQEQILRSAVGDSICRIIKKARHIEVFCDSISHKKLCIADRAIVRYIVQDSCNYVSDTEVFGRFHMYFAVKFTHWNRFVICQYDFRLHKWRILGKGNKVLKRFDLMNSEILKYALLSFPRNSALTEIREEQKK